MPIPDYPISRREAYLNAIAAGDASGIPDQPFTREEMYLDYIARNGLGASSIAGLDDVDITTPADGQTLVYDDASDKWVNADAQAAIKSGSMTLSSSWSGADPYTQTATVTGVTITANSEVSLRPTPAQIASLQENGITALVVENNSGTLTVTAIGGTTSAAMTIVCDVIEVS